MRSRFAFAPLEGTHVEGSMLAFAKACRSQRSLMSAGSGVGIGASALLLRRHVIQPALLGTETDLRNLHPSIARRNSGASGYPVVAMVDQPLMHQFSLP